MPSTGGGNLDGRADNSAPTEAMRLDRDDADWACLSHSNVLPPCVKHFSKCFFNREGGNDPHKDAKIAEGKGRKAARLGGQFRIREMRSNAPSRRLLAGHSASTNPLCALSLVLAVHPTRG